MAPECLLPGTYPVMANSCPVSETQQFNLFGQVYFLYQDNGISLMFWKESLESS
jgi:hypothetical protein